MKVFGLGLTELLIILAVALLVFGPKNLPKLGAMAGRAVKKLRGRADEEFDAAEGDGSNPEADSCGELAEAGRLPSASPRKKVVKRVVRKAAPADDEAGETPSKGEDAAEGGCDGEVS